MVDLVNGSKAKKEVKNASFMNGNSMKKLVDSGKINKAATHALDNPKKKK